MQRGEIERKNIQCYIPRFQDSCIGDPGELDAIILNLVSNAIYWLGNVQKENREIEFRFTSINDGQRVRVWIHDTGPGISKEDVEKVFWPGVTRKPGGIGMGSYGGI